MANDVKIEILYYKTNSDISLEFGIRGNYPIRLLSAVCDSSESFLRNLKRALQRSEIIITVGGYNGGIYLPSLIAKAVATSCISPNYKSQNIISKKDYPIPEASVALAPNSRNFAGFILESGPQTIISLTDDKKVRIDTVNEIVSKYITEYNNYFKIEKKSPAFKPKEEQNISLETVATIKEIAAESVLAQNEAVIPTEFEDISSVIEPTTTEPTEAEDEVVEDIEPIEADLDATITLEESSIKEDAIDEVKSEEVVSETVITETIDNSDEEPNEELQELTESVNLFTVDNPTDNEEEIEKIAQKYKRPLTDTDINIFDIPEFKKQKPLKARPQSRYMRVLCIILTIAVILSVAFSCFIGMQKKEPEKLGFYGTCAKIYNDYSLESSSLLFSRLQQLNPNIKYWLASDDKSISLPVIKTNSDINSAIKTAPNATFPEQDSVVIKVNETSQNLFIFGSAEENAAFAPLLQFFNDKDALNTSYFTTKSADESHIWNVFSAFTKSLAGDFDYLNIGESYADYLYKISSLSLINNYVTPDHRCPILMLVGIKDNEEYIVVATLDTSFSDNNDSSSNSSSTNDDQPQEDKTDEDEKEADKEAQAPGNTEIKLPTVSSKPSSTTNTSSKAPTSSKTSSVANTSAGVSTTVSSTVSSTVSKTESTVTSSNIISSSITSSVTSSATKPTVDPILTWDINLTVTKNGEKITKPATEIVAMIIEAEMGSHYPIEALKAHAVASYNWLICNGANTGKNPSVSMKTAKDRAIEAVAAVKGNVVIYDGKFAATNYYACSAGKTASNQHIWQYNNWQNTEPVPYLQSVDCSVDETVSGFKTTTTYSSETVKNLILEKLGIDVSNLPKSEWIVPRIYDSNNLYCVRVKIGGTDFQGQHLRTKLFGYYSSSNKQGLRSSAYTVTYNENDDTFTIVCKGWGHGVGMSQYGARSYANSGWTYDKILLHFFPETTIIKN